MNICGDINARCGRTQDYIEWVDEIPARCIIDSEENHYGDVFIDHLTTTNMCMLNGRIGDQMNNSFTHISNKGKSVVDYVWVPHEQLHFWQNFSVNTLSDLIESYQIDVQGIFLGRVQNTDIEVGCNTLMN